MPEKEGELRGIPIAVPTTMFSLLLFLKLTRYKENKGKNLSRRLPNRKCSHLLSITFEISITEFNYFERFPFASALDYSRVKASAMKRLRLCEMLLVRNFVMQHTVRQRGGCRERKYSRAGD